MAYISKIKVPGVTEAYLIKDNEGRLMITKASSSSAKEGDLYVDGGILYKLTGGTGVVTTVGEELQSIRQSISGAMHYIGITSTTLTDGATTPEGGLVPQSEGSLTKTSKFVAGDVVLAPAPGGSKEKYYEYVYNGNVWSAFGSTQAIGSMAYANTATGSTTITYNKSVYTGGTVSVKEYSEGASKYLNKNTVVKTVGVGGTTSASSVSKNKLKLVTTSFSVVGDTGAAVTGVTTTQKGLATTNIYGVEETTADASMVTDGTEDIAVGLADKTSVVIGLGATAAAGGSNPFVGAQVDNDECLSWIESSLGTTGIREAASENITVQKVTIASVTGLAKKSATGTTVATGALDDNKTGIITAVTGTTSVFAKKADAETTVATGALDANGAGDDVSDVISISAVTGLVTGITYTENDGVLVEGTSGADAIKVLTGITSSDKEFQVPVVKGDDITDNVTVTITVTPDART